MDCGLTFLKVFFISLANGKTYTVDIGIIVTSMTIPINLSLVSFDNMRWYRATADFALLGVKTLMIPRVLQLGFFRKNAASGAQLSPL